CPTSSSRSTMPSTTPPTSPRSSPAPRSSATFTRRSPMTRMNSPLPNPPPHAGEGRVGVAGLHGWLIIDKPYGMSSARAVALVRRSSGAQKIGHAGTLDPLATGVLPLALGEATKTVQFTAAGKKLYRFRIRWGEARDTDDREGA